MTADKIFPVPDNYKNSAHVTKEIYDDLCHQASTDSENFWKNIGYKIKRKFIALSNSYHGETIGSLSVSNIDLYKKIRK